MDFTLILKYRQSNDCNYAGETKIWSGKNLIKGSSDINMQQYLTGEKFSIIIDWKSMVCLCSSYHSCCQVQLFLSISCSFLPDHSSFPGIYFPCPEHSSLSPPFFRLCSYFSRLSSDIILAWEVFPTPKLDLVSFLSATLAPLASSCITLNYHTL